MNIVTIPNGSPSISLVVSSLVLFVRGYLFNSIEAQKSYGVYPATWTIGELQLVENSDFKS